MQRESEYLGLINHKLHALDQGGLKYRTWQKWTKRALETYGVDDAISLGYDNVLFPFLFLVWGVPGALACLACEMVLRRRSSKFANVNLAWATKV